MLELKNIHKSFDSHRVLNDVSLQIREGEFLTLLGPSGCGKTTTLRIIGGFEQPDSGEVYLNGARVTHLPPYRRNVHTVFQHYALFPHYNVFENVAFSMRLKTLPPQTIEKEVKDALSLVALSGFEKRKVSQLSGGQQQRIALARSLVGKPSLLLLDEPLGALDLKLRESMQLELKKIQQKLKMTFVYVTHDQQEALTMSDRIVVFNHGRIEQCGPAREIYEKPASSFVADFLGNANILAATLLEILPGSRAEILLEGEIKLKVPCAEALPVAAGQRLCVAIRPEKIQLHSGPSQDASKVSLPCVLNDVVYLGSSARVLLSPFSGCAKTIQATVVKYGRSGADSAGGLNGTAPGGTIWAQLDGDDILLLPPESDS
ncbi:MAG: ABC transporter ATP-binding protein [Elusimicrobia bacterium]|nr:ABC transporter ATP-binding protein [Elusimicrobiota bacterium]